MFLLNIKYANYTTLIQNKIKLVNIGLYNICNTLEANSFNEILEKIHKTCIVCGDLYGHNTLWGSSKLDHNGQIIENTIINYNMVCINTGEGTGVNTSKATLSCIDVTFASPPSCKMPLDASKQYLGKRPLPNPYRF